MTHRLDRTCEVVFMTQRGLRQQSVTEHGIRDECRQGKAVFANLRPLHSHRKVASQNQPIFWRRRIAWLIANSPTCPGWAEHSVAVGNHLREVLQEVWRVARR